MRKKSKALKNPPTPPEPPPKIIIKEGLRLPSVFGFKWLKKFFNSCIEESNYSGLKE